METNCDCPLNGVCRDYGVKGTLLQRCKGIGVTDHNRERVKGLLEATRDKLPLLPIPTNACTHLGKPTGALVSCLECNGTQLKVFTCECYGSCTIDKQGEGIAAKCKGCPDYLRRMVAVDCNTHGLGDSVVMAWIAEGCKAKGIPLMLHATGVRYDLLRILGQEPIVSKPNNLLTLHKAVDLELKNRFSRPRVQSRARYLGLGVIDTIRPKVTISDSAIQWARQTLGTKQSVVIAYQSVFSSREWDHGNWAEVAKILTGKSIPVTVIGTDIPSVLIPYRLIGKCSVEHLTAILREARVVGCIDSFPGNMAGTLDIPTVCLLSTTSPCIFSHCPSVTCYRMSDVTPVIVAGLLERKYNGNC